MVSEERGGGGAPGAGAEVPLFLSLYRGIWYQHGLIFWFSLSACRRGWSSHSACWFVLPLCPLGVLNSVEQGGSVGVGQAPAHCSDLGLSGIARVTAYFFQIFY